VTALVGQKSLLGAISNNVAAVRTENMREAKLHRRARAPPAMAPVPPIHPSSPPTIASRQSLVHERVTVDGKFLATASGRFFVRGVSYGTFAPTPEGHQFPSPAQVACDFALMKECHINSIRVYTAPPRRLLDAAADCGVRVMLGLWWPQNVAFLDNRQLTRNTRRDIVRQIRSFSDHPATFLFALGNEIPASIVRWHGRAKVERFILDLYEDAKAAAPDALITYVNYPPTEYLDLPFLDVCAFNVYLHRDGDLRAYLARLQNIAGARPLLLAEAGADSYREGDAGQAHLTRRQLETAFDEGACGAYAFTWTDDWWCGGCQVEDWAFGLVDRERSFKPAAHAVAELYRDIPFTLSEREQWPSISVVVCAYNAADTIAGCLAMRLAEHSEDGLGLSADAAEMRSRRGARFASIVHASSGLLSDGRWIAIPTGAWRFCGSVPVAVSCEGCRITRVCGRRHATVMAR
jgi:O-antigen biosynthesis protein